MEIRRTITIKLQELKEIFDETFELYTKAFNYISKIGYDQKDYNGVSLHNKTYQEVRKYLPSQLVISSRTKATEAVKSSLKKTKNKKIGSCPRSKRCSIRYDARSLTIWFDREEVSILTVNGRIKCKIFIPEHSKKYLGWKRCSADLVMRKEGIFLKIVMLKHIEDIPSNGKFYGIDRGVKKIAVVSDNRFYGGGHVRRVSDRYRRLRSRLQSCGSRSAKRHLRSIGSKEQRFRKDVNHCISKDIVSGIESGSTIIMENLTGIRKKSSKKSYDKSKDVRREINKWNFKQLESFIVYKAEGKGISVNFINPKDTSLRCSKCGHISKENRKDQSHFVCVSCGFDINADLNASRNIVFKHLETIGFYSGGVFNRPNVVDSNIWLQSPQI